MTPEPYEHATAERIRMIQAYYLRHSATNGLQRAVSDRRRRIRARRVQLFCRILAHIVVAAISLAMWWAIIWLVGLIATVRF